MSTTEQRRHVVLLGAGYLSIWSYRALKRKVGKQVDFTVVAPATAHTFHGWTGEVLSGELPPDAQLSPISEAMPTARHVRGHARSVDRAARTVEVERVDGTKQTLHYDHLIVGTGQYEDVSRVEGMEEHAFRLRDAGRTGKLVAHLDECVESARSATEEKLRAKALTVVVAGGGLAGIEASVAIAQRLARATEGTPEREYAEVVLVTPTGELAKEMPPKLRAHVRKEIQDNGVRLVAPASGRRRGLRRGEARRRFLAGGVHCGRGDREQPASVAGTRRPACRRPWSRAGRSHAADRAGGVERRRRGIRAAGVGRTVPGRRGLGDRSGKLGRRECRAGDPRPRAA